MSKQPAPQPGQVDVAPEAIESLKARVTHVQHEYLWSYLERRIAERVQAGREKYGTLLQSHNGRNALEDAWQEAVDLVMYLHQAKLEGERVSAILPFAEQILISLTARVMPVQRSGEGS